MLTSSARETLRSVDTVIVDEIHAVAQSKRGTHLMLSLERLEEITEKPPQRIGLSATQRPLSEIARFLGGQTAKGPRPVTIVDAGMTKELDVEVIVPVEDMSALDDIEPMESGSGYGTRRSIWPAIHPKVLELVQAHRSTIVFVNARRMAERLAARLNELAAETDPEAPEIAKAHHGSLAREQRLIIEDDLKSGRLKCLVATSSLELGIDMGAVDLVVQVESPGSVARGMQRIGRAGHKVGEPSRGKLFPKYRGDLLEAAVVTKRMHAGQIEETSYPRNPLDVLAQQIVAMCAVDEWKLDDLAAVVRRAAPYAELTDDVLHAVLDLLSGRYPSTEFAELRPRIVWDRRQNVLTAREGAKRLAVTSGGTIPDRGLFGVFLPDGKRVGELDEEMVYESRPGETFVLGASTWRIEDITRDRVVVTPAPGEPAKMPFWKGDKPGRPLELGRAIGATVRELRETERKNGTEAAVEVLQRECSLDELAAGNLMAYLAEQAEMAGTVPDDRTIVVERFRDEIGDWRVCILSPFGARVHAPWAMALQARLAERMGSDLQILWSDDGIILRLGEAFEDVPVDELCPSPDEIEELLTSELPSTAMFASLFREAAARALLLPRRRPDKRTPLWQQRQRSADLLQVASKYPTFPILLETTRECVRDVFDLPALKEVLRDIRSRKVRVASVETKQASPFAQSLLFGWIAVYMYEGDTPPAERRAAALALDPDLLRELLGSEELRELIDPDALATIELDLQKLSDGRRAENADELHDVLREIGDLTPMEIDIRCDGESAAWIDSLVEQRRAIPINVAGEQRFAAAEDAARYRDALGAALPIGLPQAFTEPVDDPLRDLVGRYARTHGPFLARDVASRFGVAVDRVVLALEKLAASDRLVRGEFRPDGTEREWCDVAVLRQLRRRSLARLRKEVEAVEPSVLGRFLPAWQSVISPREGPGCAHRSHLTAAGCGRPGLRAGNRRAAVPTRCLSSGRPRCVVCVRRARVGRRRLARPGGREDRPAVPRPAHVARAVAAGRASIRCDARRDPFAPRAGRRVLLDGHRDGDRRSGREGRARSALGSRVVGRGHQRHARARACARMGQAEEGAGRQASSGVVATRRAPRRSGPVVARELRAASRADADRAREGAAAARPPRCPHARSRARRGRRGRLLRRVRDPARDGGIRTRPARLFRRRTGGRAVRAARRGGASARAPGAGRRHGARPRGDRPCAAVRWCAVVARLTGTSGARRRCVRRPRRR